MNSKDFDVITTLNIIGDLKKLEQFEQTLTKKSKHSDIKFAIREYTNTRFYDKINLLLARGEFFKIGNYICSVLRELPKN